MTSPSDQLRSFPAAGVATFDAATGDFRHTFEAVYQREFGFCLPAKIIRVDDLRIRAVGHSALVAPPAAPTASGMLSKHVHDLLRYSPGALEPITTAVVGVESATEKCVLVTTPVYDLPSLCVGHNVSGPALLVDRNNTIVVDINCSAALNTHGDLIVTVGSGKDV